MWAILLPFGGGGDLPSLLLCMRAITARPWLLCVWGGQEFHDPPSQDVAQVLGWPGCHMVLRIKYMGYMSGISSVDCYLCLTSSKTINYNWPCSHHCGHVFHLIPPFSHRVQPTWLQPVFGPETISQPTSSPSSSRFILLFILLFRLLSWHWTSLHVNICRWTQ